MAKLDDFLSKKKETAPILDLSKASCSSKDEFRRLLEKVPDFKIKPEKVVVESVKIREKRFLFKSGKKDLKRMKEPYQFMNPLPLEMQSLKINDLAGVTIDWRMLTTLRPKSKMEENYFSRLVELGKMEIKSRAAEKRQFQLDPQTRKIKNKSGVVEMRVVSCTECGEDFCNGKTCKEFGYDSFARQPDIPKTTQKLSSPDSGEKTKRKIKRKPRSKSTVRRKGKSKSKSPRKRSSSKHKSKSNR
ncbi:hypothetical protein GWI33_015902 [Rhynchophorus ferrugineus]|uniref:Uncharacterized protein n=1 Tax=Rhynchophorus ferrugineus TaxID=354439 RepID=A0A834M3Z3_RHYFE|nr:hypothetical protein GWI33_015902 [Rhynchophorus ferrugineus]